MKIDEQFERILAMLGKSNQGMLELKAAMK